MLGGLREVQIRLGGCARLLEVHPRETSAVESLRSSRSHPVLALIHPPHPGVVLYIGVCNAAWSHVSAVPAHFQQNGERDRSS